MSWFVAFDKLKATCLVLCVALAALIASACSRGVNDYTGSWMGIDDTSSNYSVYQCDILAREDSDAVTIRMIQYRYVLTNKNQLAIWQGTEPHYFQGVIDSEGNLVTELGVISARPDTFQLQYGKITMTRRAKNTEAKFKYLARTNLQNKYPDMLFND